MFSESVRKDVELDPLLRKLLLWAENQTQRNEEYL